MKTANTTHDRAPMPFCFGEQYVVPSPTESQTKGPREVIFEARHLGPTGSVNGGFLAGTMAEEIDAQTVSVRLNAPVPIGEPTYIFSDGSEAYLRHSDQTLVSATIPKSGVGEARFASAEHIASSPELDVDLGPFRGCFVCGMGAPRGLGFEPHVLHDGRIGGVWHPKRSNLIDGRFVPSRYLHAVLDCPGGFAVHRQIDGFALTGSLTNRVDRLPEADEILVIVSEATFRDGRKLGATTTIFSESDEVIATSEAVWIRLGGESSTAKSPELVGSSAK